MKNIPFFSMIIATYNAGNKIIPLLDSIITQTCTSYEIIVQDGFSTDNTINNLKKYLNYLSYESKKDKGVYDAWNYAIKRSNSSWSLFLGAGDYLLSTKTLQIAKTYLENIPENIIFAYGVLEINKNDNKKSYINRSRNDVFSLLLRDMGLPFPATFIRTNFLKINSFDINFKIAGDYALVAKHINANNLAKIPLAISHFDLDGISNNKKNTNITNKERLKIQQNILKNRTNDLAQALMATAANSKEEYNFMVP